jgi:hypothetical protein
MEANLVRLIILFIVCFILWVCIRILWVCIRRVFFRGKKTKKETVLNKKEAAKKLFNEIKAENKQIATAREELKKETGQTIDDLIRQKRNKEIIPSPIKKVNQRGLNDTTEWKFSCIKCDKAIYMRCHNCAGTKFKEERSESGGRSFLMCVKCKEKTITGLHACKSNRNYWAKTSFENSRDRFSKIDSKPWLARYTDQ